MKLLRGGFVPALLAIGFLLMLGAAPTWASKPAKPTTPPDTRKLIDSVTPATSTIVIRYMESKQTHTYKIDDVTALKVNGVAGKIADIKKGMVVEDYTERDNDDLDALTLTGYGEEPKTPAKKKK